MQRLNTMIQFEHVTKTFSDGIPPVKFRALNDVSFTVNKGDSIALIGPNGAGKTTTIKLMLGFIRPTNGQITVLGRLPGDPKGLHKIGYVADHPYFYEYLTGEEYLEFCGRLMNLSSGDIRNRIRYLAGKMEMTEALKKNLRTYSRGMGQRLSMMQALLHSPELIILDEPLNGLDPVGRKLLRDLILEMKAEGKTIFFSSHILEDAEMIADRLIFLREGQVIYDGTVQEVFASEHTSYEFILEGEIPAQLIPFIEKQFHCGVTYETPYSMVKSVDQQHLQPFLNFLNEHGIRIEQITSYKPSLEDVFLKYYQERKPE